MAYVDYDFYLESYYGNVVPEADFDRLADRASDFIDTVTYGNLEDGLPTERKSLNRLKKAVCAVRNATNAAMSSNEMVTVGTNGKTTGIVVSVSSGSESISYATPQQKASGAKEWSAVYAAAGDAQKTNDLLLKTALQLLIGVRTDEGIPILYAGM